MDYPTQFDPKIVLKDPAFSIIKGVPKRDTAVVSFNRTSPALTSQSEASTRVRSAYEYLLTLRKLYSLPHLLHQYLLSNKSQHKQIHLISKPVPKAGPGQVVVHIRATGICGKLFHLYVLLGFDLFLSRGTSGSDCHFWKHGRIGESMVVRDECGAGHESAGQVIEIGEGVNTVRVGDRVAVEAGIPCGDCEFCRIGRYNACPTVVFFSTPPYHGTLTRYHLHPASWVHKIPDSVTYEEGSVLEPLSVALAGIERSGLSLGDPLLIAGAGPIGLVSLLAAHAAGATPIVLTDLSEHRLNFAKTLVPSVRTVVIERSWTAQEIATKVKEAAGLPGGLNCALECTGVESSVQAAIYFVIGVGKDFQNLPIMHMSTNEIDLKLQYRYANQYPKAIRLVEAGLINLKPLVTHRFTLENAVEAFETAVDISRGGKLAIPTRNFRKLISYFLHSDQVPNYRRRPAWIRLVDSL
ncbi:hypothetical protein P7C70_g6270, partial [Phenoliferia sp. Uapishka_3]